MDFDTDDQQNLGQLNYDSVAIVLRFHPHWEELTLKERAAYAAAAMAVLEAFKRMYTPTH